jgi:YVTN family beta-propeller protein
MDGKIPPAGFTNAGHVVEQRSTSRIMAVAVAVTPDGTRVYVANNGSNNVSVIGRPGNTVVANIPVGTGPVGVAIGPCCL